LTKGKLGQLATIDGAGTPHVVPLGWRYNQELDVIDIGGQDFVRARKFRNVQRNRTPLSWSMTYCHRGDSAA
jgi:pyridoxamine 5'-phosphate oxidase family protein